MSERCGGEEERGMMLKCIFCTINHGIRDGIDGGFEKLIQC
jgi:hypothetical protein